MEADWSVELAAVDPVIVVPWHAPDASLEFIDLRRTPKRIDEIEEACRELALRSALLALNRAPSQLVTVKCDLWKSGPEDEIDPREMDARAEDAKFAAGCYIDMVSTDGDTRTSFAMQERWIRALTARLRSLELRCARIELVLRHAEIQDIPGFGVTCFVQGCGATSELAAFRRAEALALAVPLLIQLAPDPLRLPGEGRYNGRSMGE